MPRMRLFSGPGLPTLRKQLRVNCADSLRDHGARSFLWLVPRGRWAKWLSQDLVRLSGLRASIQPQVFTLSGFLDRLRRDVRRPPAESALHLAITETIESDPEAAPSFVNARGEARPGGVKLLMRILAEHQRGGRDFPPLPRGPEQEATSILWRAQQLFKKARCQTIAMREQSSLATLSPNQLSAIFKSPAFVIVDGFDELDDRFMAVLEVLRHWTNVELLIDHTPERPSLCEHMAEKVEELMDVQVDGGELQKPPAPPLTAHFGLSDPPPNPINDERAALWDCRTPHDEAVRIAREIKQWKLDRPDLPLHRIAVAFANPERMAPIISGVLDAWGIPHDVSLPNQEGTPLADTALGQAVLSLWRLATGDLRRSDLLAFARNRLWAEAYDLDPIAIDEEGRELRIGSGADLWRERLAEAIEQTKRLIAADPSLTDEETEAQMRRQRRLARLEKLRATLDALLSDLAPLCAFTPVREALSAILDVLLRRGVLDKLSRLAPSAFDRAHSAMRVLIEEFGRSTILSRAPRSPEVAMRHGAQALANTPVKDQPLTIDAVKVIGFEEVQGLPWEAVFIGGLVEGAWPRVRPHFALGDDSPLNLGKRDENTHLAAQRHRIFQILRCDVERLIFSWPRSIDNVPQNPSPFFEEIATLLGQTDLIAEDHEAWKIESVDGIADCLSPRELQWTVGATLDASIANSSSDSLRELLRTGGDHLHSVSLGIDPVATRRRIDGWSPWEGQIADAGLLHFLNHRFTEHVWSASEAEALSKCAWRGVIERHLGLSIPEDEEEQGIHPMERGLLIHEILCAFMRGWMRETKRDRATIASSEIDKACNLMARVAEECLARKPQGELLWQVERDMLLGSESRPGLFETFVRTEAESKLDIAPAHLEWRFGMGGDDDPPPLTVTCEGHTHRLRGVIDRIERTEDSSAWAVVDYKTGSRAPGGNDIERGLHLQIPLYALAVNQLLANRDGAVIAGDIYRISGLDKIDRKSLFHLSGADALARKQRGLSMEEIEERCRIAAWHLDRIANAAAHGELHWTTRPFSEVCKKCDWSRACRRETQKANAIGPPPTPAASEGRQTP